MKRFLMAVVSASFLAASVDAAFAVDLVDRVADAKEAATTVDGASYERSLEPFVRDAIRSCVPPGSAASGNVGEFTFVADVAKEGAVRDVAIDPETKVSRCFADRLGAVKLPVPPAMPASIANAAPRVGYPIQIQLRIVQ